MQRYPIGSYRPIGYGINYPTRRAVSYTPTSDLTLYQWSFLAKRIINSSFFPSDVSFNEVNEIEWEIRTESDSGIHPSTDTSSLLASGSFDWRYTTAWKLWRPIKHTINMASPVYLDKDVRYWFILKMPNDEYMAEYPLGWIDTYVDGSGDEVDSNVFCSAYMPGGTGWLSGNNGYNLTLYILDDQAGSEWHVVIEDEGYMQPNEMKGYHCEQAATGLAQSRGGQSEYSQLRYPYSNISQHTWTGGSGQLTWDDPTAFLYALNVDTVVPNQAIIGPATHLTGTGTLNPANESSKVVAMPFPNPEYSSEIGTAAYMAQKFFVGPAGLTLTHIGVHVNRTPWRRNYNTYVSIWSSVDDAPGTMIIGEYQIPATYKWSWLDVTVPSTPLSSGPYYIVVRSDQSSGTLPEYRIMLDKVGSYDGQDALYSVDGSTWNNIDGHSLIFRLNEGVAGKMDGDVVNIISGKVGGSDRLFCLAGKVVYEWDESAGIWESISDDILGTGNTELPQTGIDLAIFDDKLLVSEGYDYPIAVYDGTTWSVGDAVSMVTNGTFDTDTSGWTAKQSGVLSSVAGGHEGNALQVENGSTLNGYALQTITVETGKWYELSFYHKNGTFSGFARAGTTETGGEYWDTSEISDTDWTRRAKTFKATSDTLYIIFACNSLSSGDTTLFDDIVLKEAVCGKYFEIGKGFLWRSNAKNTVSKTNDLVDWSADITIGESLGEITAFANYQGRFLVGKEDGIWEVDDQDLATEYLLFREHKDPNNCKGMTVWSGMLFIPVQSSIWRWQGSQYKEVGPSDKRAGPTHDWPNHITRMTATAPYLLATTEPVVTTGWGGLLIYNGMGWHHLSTSSQVNKKSRAIHTTTIYEENAMRVWYAEGERISYVRFPDYTNNRYDWPDADYEITTGSLVSSWWDGGLKDALKFWNRITLIADIPDDTSIEVYAARDGQEWLSTADFIYLGELTNDQLTETGEYTLMFADGLVAKSIQPIFILKTWDSSVTPRIKAVNVESLVRQIPTYVYSFQVVLADNITKMDGTTEQSRTANDMWNELQRFAQRNDPITVSFPGKSIRGVISYLKEDTFRYKSTGTGTEVWERLASVSVVELT